MSQLVERKLTFEPAPAAGLDPPRLSLVLPTFNEAENLERVLRELQAALVAANCKQFEIVIVDDDSPDGTGALADKLASSSSDQIRVIHRKAERGLATAVVSGWKAARGEILAVMDADRQHPPQVIPQLLRAIEEGVDLAVASRYVSGGGIPQWGVGRRLVSQLSTLITRLMVPGMVSRIQDPLSGCFALRREVIEGKSLRPLGFKILLEVLAQGNFSSVREVGYVFADRHAGKSKLGVKVAVLDALNLARLAWLTKHVQRFVKFCLVGLSGVGVNLGLLWLLKDFTAFSLGLCGAVAVAAAMGSNFALNEFWTFVDWSRLAPKLRQRLLRLGKYVLICGMGGVINVSTLVLLNRLLGLHYLLSGSTGILLAVLWNYGGNANLTWQSCKGRESIETKP